MEDRKLQKQNDEIEIDLRELWYELKKNFKLIFCVTTAFVVAAAVYSFMIAKPVYQYDAMIRIPAVYEQSRMLVNTCAEVLKNDGTADIESVRDANIIRVSVTSSSPISAKEEGKKYLVIASEKANKIIGEVHCNNNVLHKAEIILSKNDEAYLAKPNKKKNVVLAFVAGLFLSCGYVVTRYVFNKDA